MNKQEFELLFKSCGLETIIAEPKRISGGLLHKMYDVRTASGHYAVKVLNPEIMKREKALSNFIISEKIAHRLSDTINVSCSNIYNGKFIQEVSGHYCIIFDFAEGTTLKPNEITPEHSYKIGLAAAKIHSTDFSDLNIINDNTCEPSAFDWSALAEKGAENNAVRSELMNENLDDLKDLTEKMNKAKSEMFGGEIICHGDMDSKNVLWQNGDPIIIDWESASYMNPCQDFLETALYWSQNDGVSVDLERFSAFAKAYTSIKKLSCSDWENVLYLGLSSKLGWLEYNLKRSLGIECHDKEEQELGTQQVPLTIGEINNYVSQFDKILSYIQMLNL